MSEVINDEWGDDSLPRAYTRQDVEAYVADVKARRDEIKARIAAARTRAARARELRDRLDALEASVGAAVVDGYARAELARRATAGVAVAGADPSSDPALDPAPGPSPWLLRVAASVSGGTEGVSDE